MKLPLFNAEASLYTTRSSYRSGGKAYGATQNTVLAQLSSCAADCLLTYGECLGENAPNPIALGLCYVVFLICVANCPDDTPGGPGPVTCCPQGTTCECGGTCITGKKGCVGGKCLGPHQSCP